MADDSPEVARLKEQAARANAERDLAKAQLEEVQAKQKLADVETGADVAAQAAAAKSQAEAMTAVYAQQKVAAEAHGAAVNAELTALEAKFGTVTGSSVTGTVTTDAGAGTGEASLLAAQAVAAAALQIAAALPAGRRYIIFAGTQRPNLGHWRAFRVQTQLVSEAFDTAEKAKIRADNAAEDINLKALAGPQVDAGTESVATALTGAGAILDLGSKLGSYFQSDYKLGPATVTGSDDDLLAVSVAGALRDSWFPARWMPQTGDDPVSTLLTPHQSMRTGSVGKLRDVQQASERSRAAADKATDPAKKAALDEVAALYGRAAEAYTAAQKRFDDLLVSLAMVDKDGVPQVTLIIDQKTLADALAAGAYALFVRLNSSAGGYYTKKNLWTFFGGMPFFVSGGAIASYLAVDGTSGSVKAAGQFQIHSGYHKLHKVEERFLMRPAPALSAAAVALGLPAADRAAEGLDLDGHVDPEELSPEFLPLEAPRPWRVAESLKALRAQVDARAPNRNTASDGSIGDAAHAARSSDHNPWIVDGATGVVTAIDITHDPAGRCDAEALAEAIRAKRDPRVKYVIWNRRIMSATKQPWTWRAYGGSNPHTKHVHISVQPQKAMYDSGEPWAI